MALRLASTEATRLDIGEGDWIEVSSDISKKDFNRIVAKWPENVEDGFTPVQGTEFQTSMFEIFVRAWSLDDNPAVETYLDLKREDAERIDNAVMEHFNSLLVTKDEAKKPKTSRA